MKATGIVRRIDDLGRVVVPKEIRNTLGIKEGDPLELYVDGDVICFKKYSTLPEIAQTVETLVNQISDPDVLRDLEETDAIAIRALAKILQKNFNKLAQES
jgi:stage V sporulation protein T